MTDMNLPISRDEARWIAVNAAGLARRPFRRQATEADLLGVVRNLGMVQLDTISVISRSHETVLWSRLGSYDVQGFPRLYRQGDALTEYLAHAAAIIPLETLPLYRGYMERVRTRDDWAAEPENRAVMDRVLQRMHAEGALSSRHFDRPDHDRKAEAWEWYGLKPERRALDALWLGGETVLSQREASFSRVFDLPQRVIPSLWEGEAVSDGERNRIFVRKGMSVLGVSTARWVSDYFRTGGRVHVSLAQTRELMAELEASGEVIRVSVPQIDEPSWLDVQYAPLLDELRRGRQRPTLTTLLSPFDNLVWNRDRCLNLFDFHYRLECYTPAPKRTYGYYSLPILYRGKVVGRLDPSFSRKQRFLTIKSLHFEPWVRASTAMLASIRGAVEDLLRFLGGEPGAWTLLWCNRSDVLPLMTPDAVVGTIDEA